MSENKIDERKQQPEKKMANENSKVTTYNWRTKTY